MVEIHLSYQEFLETLARDIPFARGFLTHCFQSGYNFENIRHPDEITNLPEPLVIDISKALFPTYFLRISESPTDWYQ
jgi:hypothetical protein